MIRHELEHLLTNNDLVLHRCVDTIEQQDDRRPHSAAVLRPVGGHMRWKLRWQWALPLFLSFELLKGEERKLLRLSVLQDGEVLLAELVLRRMPGRVCDDNVQLPHTPLHSDHCPELTRPLLALASTHTPP